MKNFVSRITLLLAAVTLLRQPDEAIPQGVFGLQIHQGAASEAWYKDITIQVLPDKPHAP